MPLARRLGRNCRLMLRDGVLIDIQRAADGLLDAT